MILEEVEAMGSIPQEAIEKVHQRIVGIVIKLDLA